MYATIADMESRYGGDELRRLGVVDGDMAEELSDPRVQARVSQALMTATDQVDSYLRKRYLTPLAPAPASIVEAPCVLARHWLSQSGATTPSESVTEHRADTLKWLAKLADGSATLEGLTPIAKGSTARVSDRDKIYDPGPGGMW
ncbi:MAG: DUF1320 domain-containing protein [Opitutales bacterium]|nr:DUF1320 domain-containing protein [Opitutales bacterium]